MDKDLFEHIANQLQNHEEFYPQGAWERFSDQERKRKRFALWPLWTAAAVVFVCIFSYVLINQTVKQTQPKTHDFAGKKTQKTDSPIVTAGKITKPNLERNTAEKIVSRKQIQENTEIKDSREVYETHISAEELPDRIAKDTEILSYNNRNTLLNSLVNIHIAPENNSASVILVQPKPKKNSATDIKRHVTFEDILEMDSRPAQFAKQTKAQSESKWMPSVYVAPAVGNDSKVNMNYGFSISYALGKKVSLSSGVAYSALSSTEPLNFSAATAYSATNLESISTKVSGINIPLELRYNINDKLYTGIGVSALAVLDNRQQNNYVVSQFANAMFSSAGNGTPQAFLVQSRVVETQTNSNLDPDRYVGFYNFSLGYKQKISNKNNIAIEPFLRLPMKTFSKDNLNLTNGGLRIKFDF